ncbi:MAG: hypothetical protein Q9157_005741 [Trypethelium eluteriae]
MSRPQIGIDRLPPRRTTSDGPREAMNYAVPKKRGPKTDVLEALLKRVDGLEKRLHDENKPEGSVVVNESSITVESTSPTDPQESSDAPKSEPAEMQPGSPVHDSPALLTPTESLYELSARGAVENADKIIGSIRYLISRTSTLILILLGSMANLTIF